MEENHFYKMHPPTPISGASCRLLCVFAQRLQKTETFSNQLPKDSPGPEFDISQLQSGHMSVN
jgi:hypothetical protein